MLPKPLIFLFVLGGGALSLVLGEVWARSTMPASSHTPYRTAPVDGLPSILGKNIELVWQGADVQTNSFGFRGPDPTPAGEMPEDTLRIAMVGDSFVFGSGVQWEDTLGVKLEAALGELGQAVEVLNCGVPGYNTRNAAVNLAEYVMPLKPDLVIFLGFANDAEPDQNYGEIDPDHMPDQVSPYPLRSALLQRTLVVTRDLAAGLGLHLGRNTAQVQKELYAGAGGERVRDGFARMQATCSAAGIPLVVAIYPFMNRPDRNAYLPVEQGMARDAEAMGLPVVRIERAFEGFDRRDHWAHPIYDSHPDGEANTLAAALLAQRILDL